MWRVVRDEKLVWMLSLDDPHTGKRQSFTSLEDLYIFLAQLVIRTTPNQPAQTEKWKEQNLILFIKMLKEP
jgi:hypothetical protein